MGTTQPSVTTSTAVRPLRPRRMPSRPPAPRVPVVDRAESPARPYSLPLDRIETPDDRTEENARLALADPADLDGTLRLRPAQPEAETADPLSALSIAGEGSIADAAPPTGEAFGLRLRVHRERCGVTLESIAATTKIKTALLADLERGNMTHWPRGIFRRAYLRDYAAAVGLDAEPLVAEFVRIYPEDRAYAGAYAALVDSSPASADPLRLTLAVDAGDQASSVIARAATAAVEAAALIGLGAWLGSVTGTSMPATAGVLALLYYPAVSVYTRRTPPADAVMGMLSQRAREILRSSLGRR